MYYIPLVSVRVSPRTRKRIAQRIGVAKHNIVLPWTPYPRSGNDVGMIACIFREYIALYTWHTHMRTYTYRIRLRRRLAWANVYTSCFVSVAIKSNNSRRPETCVLHIYLTHHQRHHYDDDDEFVRIRWSPNEDK